MTAQCRVVEASWLPRGPSGSCHARSTAREAAMTRSERDSTIQIEDDDGQVLATAEITPTANAGAVHSDLPEDAGGAPRSRPAEPAPRPRGPGPPLGDACPEPPFAARADTLMATMPISD